MQNYQAQERYHEEDVEQEVNIREYFLILRKRKYIVFTLLVVVFVVTIIITVLHYSCIYLRHRGVD